MSSYSARSFLFRGSLVVLSSLFVFGCAFKKDTGEETPIAPAAPQAKEVPKGFFKAEVKPARQIHTFDVDLSWRGLENCEAQIRQLNMDNGQVVFLRPSVEGLADQIMRVGDLKEGTRYQFELSCLNSPIPFVEALIVKTPFDLVVDGVLTDEDLAKRGIFDLQRKEVRISRLRIHKNGELILSSSNTKVVFESGVFESGAKLKNFNEKYLVYDVAEGKKLLGKPGATIDLFGIEASGSLTLDLRGYPGERGDPGVEWSASELPSPAKNGRDAQFSFSGWPRETKQQCATRRNPNDRPSPRGDRLSAFRGCNIMFVSCVSEATDGESVRGLTGKPGGVGKQGGSTGSIKISIIDRTKLDIKAQATPGEGGEQGPGGQGGRSPGNPGLAGQVNFVPQLRQYLNLPSTMSDAEVMNSIQDKWDWAQACQYTPKPGIDYGQGILGETRNPSMVGPRGEVEDILVWEESAKTYRPIRPTFLSR